MAWAATGAWAALVLRQSHTRACATRTRRAQPTSRAPTDVVARRASWVRPGRGMYGGMGGGYGGYGMGRGGYGMNYGRY